MSAITFYGIEADRAGAGAVESFAHGWTRSDFPVHATNLHRSEYHFLIRLERAQSTALALGMLTGVLWPMAVIYFLN
jgi:hypothetical protein